MLVLTKPDKIKVLNKLARAGVSMPYRAKLKTMAVAIANSLMVEAPKSRDGYLALFELYLEGTESPRAELQPMKPLRLTRAEQIAMERVKEAQRIVGYTEKLRGA